ncbi:kinase domain protein [Bacteriovorax sp. DB6_IX]|nr:kinase domain protein [Bacteriovorax sp. DB6_IX]
MAEERKFDRFGRYLILDHLVDGGMAKICRARFLGEQADKVVAIKMVQPQFSKDESFKTMFMDEIKTTFGLLHPNIVQTYDYGLQNDQLFVAMEYCDGRNLKEYLDQLKKRNFVFPVEISVYITIQSCQGLHYAHTFTDKLTGKPANIVHRDISPHNIMLTFDGSVKVIDFGIAKSETNSEATQAGTIKGKLSYLAPEYLDGHDLDPRYDLFAVGITLWEMLCSRKLFKASNDLAVLKKIQECKVPKPSSINPNVPEELDKIVMKALHKDRNKRYQTLEEFGRALNKFLYSTYPDFNASDLSYFAKELFKEEIKKDRERLYQFGQIDIKPYLEDMKREQEGEERPLKLLKLVLVMEQVREGSGTGS